MKLDIKTVLAHHRDAVDETSAMPLEERYLKAREWLLAGEYEQGLAALDARSELIPMPDSGLPRWDGMLRPNQTLLLQAGENWEEAIQLVRYARFIAETGMRVAVQCPQELEGILQTHDGIAMAYGNREATRSGDYAIPLASLPHLFQTRLERIPLNIPYLFSRFEDVMVWRERLATFDHTIKIGLYWNSGNENLASVLLEALEGTPGVTLFDLTGGTHAGHALSFPELAGSPDRYSPVLDVLDMVIAEESWVLHLAGALGRPAWGLLPEGHGWCWGLDEYSPWYPRTRLFRQSRRADWRNAVGNVRSLLEEVMGTVMAGEA